MFYKAEKLIKILLNTILSKLFEFVCRFAA